MLQLMPTLTQHLCLLHRRQRIIHICVDSRCTNNPFLCTQCINQNIHKLLHANHEECISGFSQSLVPLAQLISSSKPHLESIFENTVGNLQNSFIIKRMQMPQRHYQSMEAHIKTLKLQVDKQIDQVLVEITKKLANHKQNVTSTLDNYLRIYIQNLQAFKLIAQPIISFNKKYKNYSNPNNLNIKIGIETKQKSSDWYLDLKRVMATTSKILEKSQQYYHTLGRSTTYIKQMCQQTPPMINSQRTLIRLSGILEEVLGDMIVVREIKPLQMFLNEGGGIERKVINGIHRQVY